MLFVALLDVKSEMIKNGATLEFSRFQCPDKGEINMGEYVAVILMINLILSCDGDELEYECLRNSDFEKYFHMTYDYPPEECARLSRMQFCEELKQVYDRSYDRFQHYAYRSKNNNPKVVEKLESQYPVYAGFLNFFKCKLKDNNSIYRINSFGRDEDMWYLVETVPDVYLISIREII